MNLENPYKTLLDKITSTPPTSSPSPWDYYIQMLESFDWYYNYSSDSHVWAYWDDCLSFIMKAKRFLSKTSSPEKANYFFNYYYKLNHGGE